MPHCRSHGFTVAHARQALLKIITQELSWMTPSQQWFSGKFIHFRDWPKSHPAETFHSRPLMIRSRGHVTEESQGTTGVWKGSSSGKHKCPVMCVHQTDAAVDPLVCEDKKLSWDHHYLIGPILSAFIYLIPSSRDSTLRSWLLTPHLWGWTHFGLIPDHILFSQSKVAKSQNNLDS